MRGRRGHGQRAADVRLALPDDDLAVPGSGEREGALEPRGPGADDAHPARPRGGARAHDQGLGRARRLAGRRQVGIHGAQQGRLEGAAVLVARDARSDLLRATGQDLERQVGVGDQRPGHAHEVGSGGERPLHRDRVAERLGDEQGPIGERAQSRDVREQRGLLGGHVAHVAPAHPDGEVHVVDAGRQERQQLPQLLEIESGVVRVADGEADADER